MTVAEEMRKIITKLRTDSGYPYEMDSHVKSAEAFAYGFAIGTLSEALKEWERRLEGGSDGR